MNNITTIRKEMKMLGINEFSSEGRMYIWNNLKIEEKEVKGKMCDLKRTGSKWHQIEELQDKVDAKNNELDLLTSRVIALESAKITKKK